MRIGVEAVLGCDAWGFSSLELYCEKSWRCGWCGPAVLVNVWGYAPSELVHRVGLVWVAVVVPPSDLVHG